MNRLVVIVSVIVNISLVTVSPETVPGCADQGAFIVCHVDGVLTEVTQNGDADELLLADYNLVSINSGAFKNLTTSRLSFLIGNNVSIEEPGAFAGLAELKTLVLRLNTVALKENLFVELKELENLDLGQNRIDTIPFGAFNGLSELKKLELDHNRISRINRDSFAETPKLMELFLDQNRITYIHPEAFKHLIDLRFLGLGSNRLATIFPNAFEGLSHLRVILLNHNALREVPRELFAGVPQLEKLSVSHNNITIISSDDFDGVPNLEVLYIEIHESAIQPGTFDEILNLKEIYLPAGVNQRVTTELFEKYSNLSIFVDGNLVPQP